VLQLALEEFEQVFTGSTASVGCAACHLDRLPARRGCAAGAAAVRPAAAGQCRRAAAGAQALAQAVDQAGLQLQQWLTQLPAKAP
jgi:hypothetical protein